MYKFDSCFSCVEVPRILLHSVFLRIQRGKGYGKPKKFSATPTLHFTEPLLLIWRNLDAASFLTLWGWEVFTKKKKKSVNNQTYPITLIFALPFCFIFLFVALMFACYFFPCCFDTRCDIIRWKRVSRWSRRLRFIALN